MWSINKGKMKRVGAALLALLLWASSTPYISFETSYAQENVNSVSNSSIIQLAQMEHQITFDGLDYGNYSMWADNKTIEDGIVEAGATAHFVIRPASGYKIDSISITKDGEAWSPSAEDDWWKEHIEGQTGYFSMTLHSVDADYHVQVTFAEKKYVFVYTLDDNGKFILNANNVEQTVVEGPVEKLSTEVDVLQNDYYIRAEVKDESYHLTSFVVNGIEMVAKDEINNNLHSKNYECWNMDEKDYEIVIETQIDTYTVSVDTEGKGHVSLSNQGAGASTTKVQSGEGLTLTVYPEDGYQIASILVDGATIKPEDCVEQTPFAYSYTIDSVTKDSEVEVQFMAIPKTKIAAKDSELTILSHTNKEIDKSKNVHYAEHYIVSVEGGHLFAVNSSDTFYDSLEIKTTQDICGYYEVENPSEFGTITYAELKKSLHLVVDDKAPMLQLDSLDKFIWLFKIPWVVDVDGHVEEENLEHAIWSLEPLTEADIMQGKGHKVNVKGNGDFSFSVDAFTMIMHDDVGVIYVYALDKVGHISQEAQVHVYGDSIAPELTQIKVSGVNGNDVNAQAYGNFTNDAIQLTITANDVKSNGSKISNASGAKEVLFFAGNATEPFKTVEATKEVTGEKSGEFIVTIPVNELGEFSQLEELSIKVKDYMGNLSEAYYASNFVDSDVLNDNFLLEQKAPVITTCVSGNDGYVICTDEGEQKWFNAVPNITYTVDDTNGEIKGSGLKERQILLNGEVLEQYTKTDYANVENYDALAQIESQTVSSGDLAAMASGENLLEVLFTDMAGNSAKWEQKVYMDTQVPTITQFTILTDGEEMVEDVVARTQFGNFHNGAVQIIVAAQDAVDAEGTAVPTAGLQSITLYLDGEAYETKPVNASGVAIFQLPAEQILDEEKLYLDAVVTATARDNVGNESIVYDMTTGNSNILSSKLMVETSKPSATILVDEKAYIGADGTAYVRENVDTIVQIADQESGLRDVMIDINNAAWILKDYTFHATEETVADTITVSMGDALLGVDNLYDMKVVVVDNAGNEYTTSQKIYKDATAPQIIEINMQAEGFNESDGSIASVAEREYGYFFREDTLVTIIASDGEDASNVGVKEIQYYTVDHKGIESERKTVAVDENNSISFVVKAGFKGQVYACAYDRLLNAEEGFVTPQALLIEAASQHAQEEHIEIAKADAPYRTAEGGELYAQDVEVTLTIKDVFSGIRDVEWSVEAPQDTKANQSGKVVVNNQGKLTKDSDDGWEITTTDRNLVTTMRKTVTVANNSNDIVMKVKMTDRSGHTAEEEIIFSIDKTIPVIEVAFDGVAPDPEFTDMYKESRTATITVKERNFSAEGMTVNITNTDGKIPALSEWTTTVNAENPDETISVATIIFAEDGDYTMEVSGHDAAMNSAETVTVIPFTIDKTLPIIRVTYDNNSPLNGNYFAQTRVATISITEHNFTESRVNVIGRATNEGSDIAFPSLSGWSQNGDVYTATIACSADALYQFDVECLDKAGNTTEPFVGEEFYIDKTFPVVEIWGIENESANNGTVAPSVTLSDLNYDINGVKLELVGANRGQVAAEGTFVEQLNGQIFHFADIPAVQSNDDIYTLHAHLTDLAGNETTESITFSVNRFGSVYVFDSSLKEMAGTYVQKPVDVCLTEVNVDSLEHDTIRIVVDANGTPRDLVEGSDYYVQENGGNGSWYQYDYVISKDVFAGDGRYIVTLYSKDRAGNINENIDESKQAEISFGVDQTAPVIIPINIEDDTQYPEDVKQATVAINDNLVLGEVEVYIDNQACEYTVDGENYTFQIPSSKEPQKITIVAKDLASNRNSHVVSDVLVTTNLFVRWYNNKPLVAGTVASATVVSGGGIGVGAFLRRRRYLLIK